MSRSAGMLFLVLVCWVPMRAPDAQAQEAAAPVTLTLQEVLRRAVQRAPEIALAHAQAERAVQAVRETRSANLPQVVTGTGLAYNNGFPLSIEGSAPSLFQVGFSQSILSRRNKNLILEAERSSDASRIGSESAENDLGARWALVYFALHQARKSEALWDKRVESAEQQQRIAATQLEAGRIRPVDLTLAEAAVLEARQQSLIVREQGKVAESELRNAVGLPPGARIETVDPAIDSALPPASADELYRRALETHPQVRQAEARLRAREFHVEAEKGESWPRLELVSQYALFSRANNYQDFFNRFTRNNFLFGLSVQFPVFNGFRTDARVAQSRQEAAEARLELERLKNEIRLGIDRSLSALAIARAATELSRKQLEASRQLLEVNESLFESGRLPAKELEDVRNQVREKELAAVEADRMRFERAVDVLRSVGIISSLF
jgi:outer membrane protein